VDLFLLALLVVDVLVCGRNGCNLRRIPILLYGYGTICHAMVNKRSAVAEMGDRGHNRHGPIRGDAVRLSWSAGNPSNTMWPARGLFPYQVASSSSRLVTIVEDATRRIGISVRTTTLLSKCVQ